MALRKSCKERGRWLTDNRNNRSQIRKHGIFEPLDVFHFFLCVDWRLALLLADLPSFTEHLILLPAFPSMLFCSPRVSSSLTSCLFLTYCVVESFFWLFLLLLLRLLPHSLSICKPWAWEKLAITQHLTSTLKNLTSLALLL